MGYEDILASVYLFSRLERSDLARLAKLATPRTFAAWETIVKEGDQAVAFYVIVRGKVEVVQGGKQRAVSGPGDFFGEMALLDNYPRSATVRALEDTECLVLTRWDFAAELNSNPQIAHALLTVLSRRVRELMGEAVH